MLLLVRRICLQQVSDTAVLPCGHLVMCRYCAKAFDLAAWLPRLRTMEVCFRDTARD